WNWKQRTLPLRLPPGAKPLALRVDGRWVTDLPAAADASAADAVPVELPVPGGATLHRYEVVYAVDRPAWRFWTRLEAQEPGLPVRRLDSRCTWLLAPGVVPLFDGVCQRLPGAGATGTPLSALLVPGRDLAALFHRGSAENSMEVRQQRLTDAATALARDEAP